ncbi:unnamed protein product [Lactuca saligna]|uniref:Uncharacterized protein n=1 Tax=Lactuca saligna TaxID=75948 RepID=A0AA36EMQ0_LACSI|nr:unnamed protein product [Lactuca saligna]
MDEALSVEVDLTTPGHSIAKVGEKSKWEGPFESSRKKKKGHQHKKNDKINFCKKCYSTHNGPCSDSIMSYRRCDESYEWSCMKPKLNASDSGKKTDAPKVQVQAFQRTTNEARHDDEVIVITFYCE